MTINYKIGGYSIFDYECGWYRNASVKYELQILNYERRNPQCS